MPKDIAGGLYEFERKSQGFLSKISKIEIDPKEAATQALQKLTTVGFFSRKKKGEGRNKNISNIDELFADNPIRIIEDIDDGVVRFTSKSLKGNIELPKHLQFNKLTPNIVESLVSKDPNAVITVMSLDKVPTSYKHPGGVHGAFSTGVYVQHPKSKDILLPLEGFVELTQKLIIEETIRAYEALGAKSIEIEDISSITKSTKSGRKGVEAGANYNKDKSVLRRKEFGPGVFDPDRAKNEKYFIWDIPSVVSTIEGRIHGNQTLEEFTENVNLSVGVSVDAIAAFSSESNYNLQRKWRFRVEFYAK